jgi:mono/diheme cytochrome c family protein
MLTCATVDPAVKGVAVASRIAHAAVAMLFGSSAMAGPSAADGRELYQTNGCINCHGLSGKGDGPAAVALPTKPADLRDPSRFKKGSTEAEIARTLREGITVEHVERVERELDVTHHILAMPKFDHLTETERRSIALYIISLSKQKN